MSVAVGAALGAVCRYLLDRAVGRPPWGIATVNLLGSLLAGVLAGLAPGGLVGTVLGVGLLGGFTTASTLAADLLRLHDEDRDRTAALDLTVSVAGGLALGALGLLLGRAL